LNTVENSTDTGIDSDSVSEPESLPSTLSQKINLLEFKAIYSRKWNRYGLQSN